MSRPSHRPKPGPRQAGRAFCVRPPSPQFFGESSARRWRPACPAVWSPRQGSALAALAQAAFSSFHPPADPAPRASAWPQAAPQPSALLSPPFASFDSFRPIVFQIPFHPPAPLPKASPTMLASLRSRLSRLHPSRPGRPTSHIPHPMLYYRYAGGICHGLLFRRPFAEVKPKVSRLEDGACPISPT
jgi:hypothetical protein